MVPEELEPTRDLVPQVDAVGQHRAPVLVELGALQCIALVVLDVGRPGVGIGRPVQEVGIRVDDEGVARVVLVVRIDLRIAELLPEEGEVKVQRAPLAAGQDVLLEIGVVGPRPGHRPVGSVDVRSVLRIVDALVDDAGDGP